MTQDVHTFLGIEYLTIFKVSLLAIAGIFATLLSNFFLWLAFPKNPLKKLLGPPFYTEVGSAFMMAFPQVLIAIGGLAFVITFPKARKKRFNHSPLFDEIPKWCKAWCGINTYLWITSTALLTISILFFTYLNLK